MPVTENACVKNAYFPRFLQPVCASFSRKENNKLTALNRAETKARLVKKNPVVPDKSSPIGSESDAN